MFIAARPPVLTPLRWRLRPRSIRLSPQDNRTAGNSSSPLASHCRISVVSSSRVAITILPRLGFLSRQTTVNRPSVTHSLRRAETTPRHSVAGSPHEAPDPLHLRPTPRKTPFGIHIAPTHLYQPSQPRCLSPRAPLINRAMNGSAGTRITNHSRIFASSILKISRSWKGRRLGRCRERRALAPATPFWARRQPTADGSATSANPPLEGSGSAPTSIGIPMARRSGKVPFQSSASTSPCDASHHS
jgi:hypothetical protein